MPYGVKREPNLNPAPPPTLECQFAQHPLLNNSSLLYPKRLAGLLRSELPGSLWNENAGLLVQSVFRILNLMTATPLTSMWGFRMSRALCGCAGCSLTRSKQSMHLPCQPVLWIVMSPRAVLSSFLFISLSYTASRRQSQGLNPDGLIPLNHARVP